MASTIGRAAIVILVMFSYPLQVHPCRASIDAVLRWRPVSSSSSNKPQYDTTNAHDSALLSHRQQSPANSFMSSSSSKLLPPKTKSSTTNTNSMSDLRFALITTAIIVLSYIAALTISSLEKVLAYVGSTGSTSISFILPGLFYYKISDPEGGLAWRISRDDGDDEDEVDSDDNVDDDLATVEDERGWLAENISRNGSDSRRRGSRNRSRSGGRWLIRKFIRRCRRWSRGKDILRKLSLALAVYGVVVMVVCLATNTFLV